MHADLLAHHWPLDRVAIGPTLQRYQTRSVIALHSPQGNYVAKVYDNDCALGLVAPSREEIDRCLYVFDYLQERAFKQIPRLLKTKSGDRYLRTDTKTIYIVEQISGAHPVPSAESYRKLGQTAAGLNAFTDYPYDYPIPVGGVINELRARGGSIPIQAAVS